MVITNFARIYAREFLFLFYNRGNWIAYTLGVQKRESFVERYRQHGQVVARAVRIRDCQ